MTIQQLMCNPLQENCYIVSDETSECVIIDCGAYFEEEHRALASYISSNGLKPVRLLATHGHLDHNFGNQQLFSTYGLKVEVCREDSFLIEHLTEQAEQLFGIQISDDQPEVGRWLADGDVISFGRHQLQVIQTPGHTPGSALLYCASEHVVFSGDTLFRMSIGRTDFEGGSWAQMQHSLMHRVAYLPEDTIVYAGHGPQSTIGDELKYNPYLHG